MDKFHQNGVLPFSGYIEESIFYPEFDKLHHIPRKSKDG
jgi:hypothetical protein